MLPMPMMGSMGVPGGGKTGGLGPELWVSPNVLSGWVDNGDGSYTKPNGANASLTVTAALILGRTYQVNWTIDDQTGTQTIRPFVGTGSVAPNTAVVGFNTITLPAAGNTTAYMNSGNSSGGTVRNISWREVL